MDRNRICPLNGPALGQDEGIHAIMILNHWDIQICHRMSRIAKRKFARLVRKNFILSLFAFAKVGNRTLSSGQSLGTNLVVFCRQRFPVRWTGTFWLELP
jgi:hypothetical protein